MRGFVDNAKRCKQKTDMESFVKCVCYILMFKILLTVVLCNRCIVMIMNLYSLLETFWNYYTELYGINASIMQRQARPPLSRVLIVCPTHCNSSRLHLFVAILVQIASSRCYDLCSFIWHVYQMCAWHGIHLYTQLICMGLCGLDNHFTTIMKLKDLPSL